MIVRLHNLSARTPALSDMQAVVDLVRLSAAAEAENADLTEEDIRRSWQAPDFHLATDAWVIVTRDGQIVGYADIHSDEAGFLAFLCVHPDYRGRGIGTLFVWLVEERARQLMHRLPAEQRVVLSTVLSSQNERAREVFTREGYTLARRFWRVIIAMEEVTSQAGDEFSRHGQLAVDLVIDTENLLGRDQTTPRTGMYSARQYEVYAKELRPAYLAEVDLVDAVQCARA